MFLAYESRLAPRAAKNDVYATIMKWILSAHEDRCRTILKIQMLFTRRDLLAVEFIKGEIQSGACNSSDASIPDAIAAVAYGIRIALNESDLDGKTLASVVGRDLAT
jgi:hypothetical protein